MQPPSILSVAQRWSRHNLIFFFFFEIYTPEIFSFFANNKINGPLSILFCINTTSYNSVIMIFFFFFKIYTLEIFSFFFSLRIIKLMILFPFGYKYNGDWLTFFSSSSKLILLKYSLFLRIIKLMVFLPFCYKYNDDWLTFFSSSSSKLILLKYSSFLRIMQVERNQIVFFPSCYKYKTVIDRLLFSFLLQN